MVEILEGGRKRFIQSVFQIYHIRQPVKDCVVRFNFLFDKKIPTEDLEILKPICSHNDFSTGIKGSYFDKKLFSPEFKNYWENLIILFPSLLKNPFVQEKI
jgi:hypothetical protein